MRWLIPVDVALPCSVWGAIDPNLEQVSECSVVRVSSQSLGQENARDPTWCKKSRSLSALEVLDQSLFCSFQDCLCPSSIESLAGSGQKAMLFMLASAVNYYVGLSSSKTPPVLVLENVTSVGFQPFKSACLSGTISTSPSDENLPQQSSKPSADELAPFLEEGKLSRAFEVLGVLGRGGFGSVYKVRHRLDDQIYAVKVVELTVNPAQPLRYDDLFREVRAAAKLDSKHLVRYHSCWLESTGMPTAPDSDSEEDSEESVADLPGHTYYLYIQQEYCPGLTLDKWLKRQRSFNAVRSMFTQLLKGCQAIHQTGLIHRDLKPSNIFVDSHCQVKIGDFGLAVPSHLRKFSRKVGTALYAAPEQATANYSQAVDVYALGLILAEMCGAFCTQHEKLHAFRSIKTMKCVPENVCEQQGGNVKELILWLTTPEPAKRPSVAEVLRSSLKV